MSPITYGKCVAARETRHGHCNRGSQQAACRLFLTARKHRVDAANDSADFGDEGRKRLRLLAHDDHHRRDVVVEYGVGDERGVDVCVRFACAMKGWSGVVADGCEGVWVCGQVGVGGGGPRGWGEARLPSNHSSLRGRYSL